MARRRFFEHSSILPVASGGAPLSPSHVRSRPSRAIATLIRRLQVAIASAPPHDAHVLRRTLAQLEDASQLHAQAALFETLGDVVKTLDIIGNCFPGPLQNAVMDGQEVSLAALDAEITQMMAAKKRVLEPPRFEHGIMFRKTSATQSRLADRIEATLLAQRRRD